MDGSGDSYRGGQGGGHKCIPEKFVDNFMVRTRGPITAERLAWQCVWELSAGYRGRKTEELA